MKVSALWRYPVKSMLGERLTEAAVDERGMLGDRLFAVRDTEGKFGSGKNTRRFRRMDGLFRFRARYAPELVITLPDGDTVHGDDPLVHQRIRDHLRRDDVELAREDLIRHHDVGALHVVSTSSLQWLRERVPSVRVDERRLRPNLVVDTGDGSGLPEEEWIGRSAQIGADVVIEFFERTERCVMVNNAQDDLEASPQPLRAIAADNGRCLGVHARVLTGGTLHLGDKVS